MPRLHHTLTRSSDLGCEVERRDPRGLEREQQGDRLHHRRFRLDSGWDPARAFFEARRVREPDAGTTSSWQGWSDELEGSHSESASTIRLPRILRILGPSSLTLYKHILGR